MQDDEAVGRTEQANDVVPADLAARLAATLGERAPGDSTLPPLGHWLLFQTWRPPDGLGPDGHPVRGGFLPAEPSLPRRMWAGGRVEFGQAIRAGDALARRSTIERIEEKRGGSGRLLFVTVRHEIAGPRGLAIAEQQDLVYRGAEAPASRPPEPEPPPPAGALVREIVPDTVLLFRYSALTGNGHRIHYDLDYARSVEFYPGLVVHGPLQATLLAWLAQGLAPDRALRRFTFRGRRPAYGGRPLRLEGWRDGETVRLRTRDADGAACMTAEAEFGGPTRAEGDATP
jgi:3-methylfumaryl-CoA hydratase